MWWRGWEARQARQEGEGGRWSLQYLCLLMIVYISLSPTNGVILKCKNSPDEAEAGQQLVPGGEGWGRGSPATAHPRLALPCSLGNFYWPKFNVLKVSLRQDGLILLITCLVIISNRTNHF